MSVHIKQKFLPAWLLRCDRLGWTGGDWLVRTKGTSGAKGKEKEKSSEGCHFDNFVNSSKGTGLSDSTVAILLDAVQMLQAPSRSRSESTTQSLGVDFCPSFFQQVEHILTYEHFKPQL